jgi:hypothetical protein
MKFLRFQPQFGHVLATINAANSAQNCPKLTKTAKICQNLSNNKTLKFHRKSRFECFSKIKISTCRRGTRACFHHLDFQSKNFSYAIFIVKKMAFVGEFQHTPLWKLMIFSRFHTLRGHEILWTCT